MLRTIPFADRTRQDLDDLGKQRLLSLLALGPDFLYLDNRPSHPAARRNLLTSPNET